MIRLRPAFWVNKEPPEIFLKLQNEFHKNFRIV